MSTPLPMERPADPARVPCLHGCGRSISAVAVDRLRPDGRFDCHLCQDVPTVPVVAPFTRPEAVAFVRELLAEAEEQRGRWVRAHEHHSPSFRSPSRMERETILRARRLTRLAEYLETLESSP